MNTEDIKEHFADYLAQIDSNAIDNLWAKQSERFRHFWSARIMAPGKPLTDDEIDEMVLILDKNAKGSKPGTQAVAKMMIPQGQWRKMFKELQRNKEMSSTLNDLFRAQTDSERIDLINRLYILNEGNKNHMTGKSGNGINGLLAAYNPDANCFIVSLDSRLRICKVLGIPMPEQLESLSKGEQLMLSNKLLLEGLKNMGFNYTPRILSEFCYYAPIKKLANEVELESSTDVSSEQSDNTEEEFLKSMAAFEAEDVFDYFEVLDQILAGLQISSPDKRITFSCKRKRLVLTIGQRYCFALYREAGEVVWGCISNKKLNRDSDLWEGPHKSYFTKLTSAQDVTEHLDSIIEGSRNELERTKHSGFRNSNNSYFEKAAFDSIYRSKILSGETTTSIQIQLPMNLNQILFGPPGTGKTFHTVNEAVKIVDPEFYKANEHNRGKLKERFRELLIKDWDNTKGQIAFCTFHQSFGYEDFVEGIKPMKPVEGDSYLKYIVEDGIFKRICRLSEDSRKSKQLKSERLISWNEETFRKAAFYKISLGDSNNPEDQEIFDYCIKNNCIAIGYGGMNDFTGLDEKAIVKKCKELGMNDFTAQALNYFIHYLKHDNYVLISYGNSYVRALAKVTGTYFYNPDAGIRYNHFRKVEWLITDQTIPIDTLYDRKLSQATIYKLDGSGIKKDFFVSGGQSVKPDAITKDKNYVLVIDEINRGNISSIFGELITLIEKDKRAAGDEELEVTLPYSKEPFKVPDNVYIIGTMNTADRSIEALDTALRRRFSFREMQSKPDILIKESASKGKINNIDLVKLLTTINQRIEKLIDKDHTIGHAYFMEDTSEDALRNTFNNKVIPLLQEYFFGDFGKIGLVLGNSFIEKANDGFEFAKFEGYDSSVSTDLKERPVYRIADSDKWNFQAVYE